MIGRAAWRTSRRSLRAIGVEFGGACLSLVFVVVLGFFLFRVLPGDPVVSMTRDRPISALQVAELRARLGVDRPLWEQFGGYLAALAHGDLGTSFEFRRPVAELIVQRLGPTLLLVGTATMMAVLLGMWLGTRSAWRRGSVFDRATTSVALTLWSVPPFFLGLVVLMVFAAGFGLFPTRGMSSPDTLDATLPRVLDTAHHMVLPCLTLVAASYAQYLLVMRASLMEEMGADYLTLARAKGLRDATVRRRHAVPNALLPTVTLSFLHFGSAVTGTITVETVFSWPGLGLLTFQALRVPDLPLLQGAFLVFSASVIAMNLVADLLYRVLDPRVRVK